MNHQSSSFFFCLKLTAAAQIYFFKDELIATHNDSDI